MRSCPTTIILKMRAQVNLVLIMLTLLTVHTAFGSGNDRASAGIRENFNFYSSRIPSQKVYLHTDKAEYTAGETIWFRAYLVDGTTHIPFSDTSNVYVELINADGNTMEMRILLSDTGFASGDIRLRSELPDGNYVLRAYTDWMRNFSEDYFYNRYLYISNPDFDDMIPRSDLRSNRRFNRQLRRISGEYQAETFPEKITDFFFRLFASGPEDHQAAFFPEGGNLVEGTLNRVAFKIADPLGHGIQAEAEITDRHGEIAASFTTDSGGIGVFEFTPEKGNTYTAGLTFNGQTSHHDLPAASQENYALRVDRDGEQIRVTITSTVIPANPAWSDELILIGHTRGRLCVAETLQLRDGTVEMAVDKESFPTGIAHFTIFTSGHVPVAERLLFINHGDELTFLPSVRSEGGDEPGYLDVRLDVRDQLGDPVAGSFSLSALTGQPDNDVHNTDILSFLLLESDLKGMTGDISGYLLSGDDYNELIDNLLLTHGWRRFDWENLMAGELPEISIVPSRGLSIGGTIRDPARNESLRNYPVSMRILNEDDELLSTRTGRNGHFAFTGLLFHGNTRVVLSSRRLPGNYPPVIELNVRQGRGYEYEPGIYTREQNITSRGDDWTRQRGASASPYGHTTSRHVTPQLYGTPDQTIYVDYETSTERNLFEVLRNRATGLMFDGNRIMIRGPSSIMLSNEPRFMLDGSFIDRNTFLGLFPRDVERVEIFRGTRAAIFGVRGGTGVIIAYSRRPGYHGFEDALELVMLGYHAPADFYPDRISVAGLSPLERRIGKTVYWEPALKSGDNGEIHVRIPLHREMDRMVIRVEGAGYEGGIGTAEFNIGIDRD